MSELNVRKNDVDDDDQFISFCSSYYEGWDNPFRPEGELSHEAEELLRLWKEGKLKKAPPEAENDVNAPHSPSNKQQQNGSGNSTQQQQQQQVEVKREKVPGLGKVHQVHLDGGGDGVDGSGIPEKEPKKKKQGCCSLM